MPTIPNKVINHPRQYISMEEREKASTTVEIDKELLLKFKSICVLREVTMSDEIEEMVREWVARNEGAGPAAPETAGEPSHEPRKKSSGAEEISDEMEKQVEEG
jgi:hypothetical protein